MYWLIFDSDNRHKVGLHLPAKAKCWFPSCYSASTRKSFAPIIEELRNMRARYILLHECERGKCVVLVCGESVKSWAMRRLHGRARRFSSNVYVARKNSKSSALVERVAEGLKETFGGNVYVQLSASVVEEGR